MNIVLKCLIIDDEPFAQEVIENHAEKVPYLQVIKKSGNAIEGLNDINEYKPDLVFMDIQMPVMTGLDLIRILDIHQPSIIITTASPNYALDGFELDVVDYLLKPISFERFFKAVNKVYLRAKNPHSTINLGNTEMVDRGTHFWAKVDGAMQYIAFEDVLIVKGMKDYVQIYLKDRKIITYLTMKKIEEYLPPQDFLRVSRSYIVRKSAIKALNGNTLETDVKEEIIVGSTYRDTLRSEIDKWLR